MQDAIMRQKWCKAPIQCVLLIIIYKGCDILWIIKDPVNNSKIYILILLLFVIVAIADI